MRCPRVSRGRVYAGFTGCIANATRGGCTAAAPAAPDAPLEPAAAPPVAFPEPAALAASAEFTPAIPSASAATFGLGIEGNSRAAPESFAATLTASGAFAADFANSPLRGSAPSRRIVASSIVHLSACESNSVPTRNKVNILYQRPVGTGPLVTFCLVPFFGPSVLRFSNSCTRRTRPKLFSFSAPPYPRSGGLQTGRSTPATAFRPALPGESP